MRLITRSDFDGLACATLLEEIGVVDDYLFVHPKDVQDGKVVAGQGDVVANVPYIPGCGMWFDHHSSEEERLATIGALPVEGAAYRAPSCARVIYDHFGGSTRFWMFDESGLMDAVDRSDSGNLTREEILHPQGWMLLSFVMDPRTGLGRYKDYRISNIALMREMIGFCRTLSIEAILAQPDVVERVTRYSAQEAEYETMLRTRARLDGNVLLLDLREQEEILSGNRFVEYALFPEQNVSVRLLWGRERQNVVCTVGHSVLNRTCNTDIGSLLLKYGGGGHRQVGTCQLDAVLAEQAVQEILAVLREQG